MVEMTDEKKEQGLHWNVPKLRLIAESLKLCAEQEEYSDEDMHLAQEIIDDIDGALMNALEQMKGLDREKQQNLMDLTNWKQLSGHEDWDYLEWLRRHNLEEEKARYLVATGVRTSFAEYMRERYEDEKAEHEKRVREMLGER